MVQKARLMQRCTAPQEPWRNVTCLSWSQVSRGGSGMEVPAPVLLAVPPRGGLIGLITASKPEFSLLLPDLAYKLG